MKNKLRSVHNKINDPQFHTVLTTKLANVAAIFGVWMIPLITGTEILVIFHYREC